MKGGLAIGLLAGTFLGLAIGFVTFSGEPGAEALDVDLGVDVQRAATADRETPRAPASATPLPAAPAAEERAASVAPLERERSVSSVPRAGDGVIEGTVSDEDGAPVAGVVLRARKASERNLSDQDDVGHVPVDKSLEEVLEEATEEWNEERASRRETTTDADGRYRFDELVDGKYGLSAHAAGFQIEPRSGSSWSIRPGSTLNWKALPVVELPIAVTLPGGGAIEKVGLRRTVDRRGGRAATDLLWRRDRRTLKVAPGTVTLKAFVDEPLSRKLGLPEMVSDEETVDVLSDRAPDPVVLELRRQRGIRGRVVVPDDVPFTQARALLVPAPSTGAVDPAVFEGAETSTWLSSGRVEFEFLDLKPGRYAVGIAKGWNSPAIAHEVVDVADGVESVEVELPAADARAGLLVRVRNHLGDAVRVNSFSYVAKTGNSSHSSHLQSSPSGPGEYAVEFDARLRKLFEDGAFPADTSIDLMIQSRKLGTKTVELAAGRRELDVTFLEPATLDVTVAGYVGSGLEGMLRLNLERRGDRSGWAHSSGGGGIAADGTESLGPVEVGEHVLQLKIRDRRGGYWNDRTLVSQELRLGPGRNVTTIAVPPLYSLTVRFDAPGGHLQVSADGGFHLHRQLDEETVVLDALAAGKYTLQRWGSSKQNGTMVVSIPEQRDVRFEVSAKNGLAVYIHDAAAWIQAAGFESGDVIVAFAGTEFGDETEMRAVWTEAVKAGKRGVTVLRDGKRQSIDVALEDLMVKGEEGANLRPASW